MMDLKGKLLIIAALIFIGLGMVLILQWRTSDNLRLIFCDVGQGDGMVVASGSKQVVIDGGRGSKMADCLGQKLPFWDRTLEMVVLTHPQQDHLEGLIEVLARYKVKTIVTTQVGNKTQTFQVWQEAVAKEGAKIYQPDIGDRLVLGSASLQVLWPSFAQAAQWQANPPSDLNETSIILRLEAGSSADSTSSLQAGSGSAICAYLTGDLPKEILETLIDKPCAVLKVSHHGSKTGTNKEILDKADPDLAIIQVGKNSFGHPHREVMDLFESNKVKVLRNDINGIIEVEVKDGKFKVKTER